MEIKGENIVFLLGAGCSVEAGIPVSNQMVQQIDDLVQTNEDWKEFRELYHYLKASIHYSDGILGNFDETFNIERLLIVIEEIEKRDKNIMYPFIGTWNNRLLDLGGTNFENITRFKKLIRKRLNAWVRINNYEQAAYYQGFDSLQGEIGELIKVFSLNYDLCFERTVGKLRTIEAGFTKGSQEWHYSNFENTEGKHFFLYKLHGSIDWYIKEPGPKLYISDDPVDVPELLFGIQNKMTSVDPYFYYSSELRRASLNNTKLIIIIGYSFSDEYVNVILSQAVKAKNDIRLLCISPVIDEVETKEMIKTRLKLDNTVQLIVENITAKGFLTETLSKDYLAGKIVEPEHVPFK